MCTPAIADLDGDGNHELIVAVSYFFDRAYYDSTSTEASCRLTWTCRCTLHLALSCLTSRRTPSSGRSTSTCQLTTCSSGALPAVTSVCSDHLLSLEVFCDHLFSLAGLPDVTGSTCLCLASDYGWQAQQFDPAATLCLPCDRHSGLHHSFQNRQVPATSALPGIASLHGRCAETSLLQRG